MESNSAARSISARGAITGSIGVASPAVDDVERRAVAGDDEGEHGVQRQAHGRPRQGEGAGTVEQSSACRVEGAEVRHSMPRPPPGSAHPAGISRAVP